jgi:hypothetical protein
MDTILDGIFHGLFSAVDPLGMVLRTLMALLADALAQVSTGMYSSLFEVTTIDLQQAAVSNIWKITTGLSASVATILLIVAAFRSMVAQSNRYLMAALPGVVLALLGPQALTVVLPAATTLFTGLAEAIVQSATPDLAASIRLLAGVGDNALYEGLGLMAPIIAMMLLFGLTTVFFVLLFCMAIAAVLYVLSPFAFAGLVMAPTRVWFTKWATGMFAVLFAKVPIAIMLALSVSLFANSAHGGVAQSFANAGAGLILGLGALLSPLMAYALFSFMGSVVVRPAVPSGSPTRALGSAYYGSQMGRAGINGARSVMGKAKGTVTGSTGQAAGDSSSGLSATTPAATEPSAAARANGAPVTPPSPSAAPSSPTPAGRPAAGVGPGADTVTATGAPGAAGTTAAGSGAAAGSAAGSGAGSGAATVGTAAAAGAATAGVGAVVVVAAQGAKSAGSAAKDKVTGTAGSLAASAGSNPSSPPSEEPGPQIDARRTT